MKITEVGPIEDVFCEIRDGLAQQDAEALKRSARKMQEVSKPAVTMDMLAPLLFQEDSSRSKLSSEDALTILGFLVESDRSKYLQPASLSVKNEAFRLTTSEHAMVVSPKLLHVMVSQLSGDDVQASTNATEALVACCRKLGPPLGDPAVRAVTEAWNQSASQANKSQASTVGVRCATAVVEMACLDDAIFQLALDCGALTLLLGMLTDASDPLLQMSALDLIEKLTITRPMHHDRARWLFSNSVLEPLLKLAGGNEDDAGPDPILGGNALRVVAALCKLAHQDSTLFGLNESIILTGFHRSLHNFESSGEMDRLALIDAISSFASASPDALELVLNDPVTREAWLFLGVAQPKLKSAILVSVAMVVDPSLGVDTSRDSRPSSLPATEAMKLYAALGTTNGTETTELVMSLAKSPLPETRLGAYALLNAVAKIPTGGQVLFAYPDFFEWLMNREREKTKEGREAKYEIVKAIVDSEVKGLLADDIVRQLETYIKQGPHYVKALGWELATE